MAIFFFVERRKRRKFAVLKVDNQRKSKFKFNIKTKKTMLVNNLLIKRIDKKEGKSQSTGNEWKNCVVILEFEDEFDKSYISAVADADYWNSLGYEEGQIVSLNLKFRTRTSFTGFVTNDIRIVEPLNA